MQGDHIALKKLLVGCLVLLPDLKENHPFFHAEGRKVSHEGLIFKSEGRKKVPRGWEEFGRIRD